MGFLAHFGRTVAAPRWPCSESYECSGNSLVSPELYLDLPEWGYGVFKLIRKGERV